MMTWVRRPCKGKPPTSQIFGRGTTGQTVSESALPRPRSGRAELTPFNESDGATVLETLPTDQGALQVEVVVDRAVKRGEFLQTLHPPEATHRTLPSSAWLVGILDAVVQPTTYFPRIEGAQTSERRAVGGQAIRNDRLRRAMPATRFCKNFTSRTCGSRVPSCQDAS